MKSKKCQRCARQAKTELAHLGPLCANCFCTAIEKRIRKYVRVNKIFAKGDKIAAIGEINQYLIPRIIKGLPAKIIFAKKVVKKKGYKIVENWTVDDEACSFLEEIFTGKTIKRPLSILNWATDKELELFAHFKSLHFQANKKNPDIKAMLDGLEEKHPETKFSLIKSRQQLESLGKK